MQQILATHRVAVLALEPVVAFDLTIAAQTFGGDAHDRYTVIVCAAAGGSVATTSDFTIAGLAGLDELARADTVLVPGFRRTASIPEPALQALRDAHDRGARIASICTGAFALAAAGLLDGRRATTHWAHADDLALLHPRVAVDPTVLYVDEGQVLTSAGLAAGLDLCLHLIETDHGPAAAIDRARHMVVPRHRAGGQAQYIPDPRRDSTVDLEALLTWARSHLADPITLANLARQANVAPRTLARHFTQQLRTSPYSWLNTERTRAAAALLEDPDLSVAAIAARVGLGTPANLRLHFDRVFNCSPTAYRAAFYGTQH